MNIDRAARRRLHAGTMAAAPVLALGLLRLLTGAGPQEAPAAPGDGAAAGPAPAVVAAPVSAAQRRAMDWLRSRPAGVAASPMDHPPAAPAEVREPAPAAARAAAVEEVRPAVTAIVGRGAGARALVNGKVLGVGDLVAPGWTVESIDAREQVVGITGPDGVVRKVGVRREAP